MHSLLLSYPQVFSGQKWFNGLTPQAPQALVALANSKKKKKKSLSSGLILGQLPGDNH